MSDNDQPLSRHERRVAARDRLHAELAERRATRQSERAHAARLARIRRLAFAGLVLAVLGVGGALAFGDFVDRPSAGATAGVIDVQSSMAGFTPSEIRVKAGETVTLNWWTDDGAPHLEGGVHTMVSEELGLYEELPAESVRLVTWTAPATPGTYDVYCDSCCGGKDSPSMHGKIVVEPATANVTGQVVG